MAGESGPEVIAAQLPEIVIAMRNLKWNTTLAARRAAITPQQAAARLETAYRETAKVSNTHLLEMRDLILQYLSQRYASLDTLAQLDEVAPLKDRSKWEQARPLLHVNIDPAN